MPGGAPTGTEGWDGYRGRNYIVPVVKERSEDGEQIYRPDIKASWFNVDFLPERYRCVGEWDLCDCCWWMFRVLNQSIISEFMNHCRKWQKTCRQSEMMMNRDSDGWIRAGLTRHKKAKFRENWRQIKRVQRKYRFNRELRKKQGTRFPPDGVSKKKKKNR